MRTLVRSLLQLSAFSLLSLSCSAIAEQWKPLCVEGSSCSAPYRVHLGGGYGGYWPIDPYAAGPLATTEGILLLHRPIFYGDCEEEYCRQSESYYRELFQLSTTGMNPLDIGPSYMSDVSGIELESGRKIECYLSGAWAWHDPGDGYQYIDWNGLDALNANLAGVTGPPVEADGVLYMGILFGGGQTISKSFDNGDTWTRGATKTDSGGEFIIGGDRYNLLTSPEQDEIWAIHSEFWEQPGSLWRSTDQGATWVQVDDGSFPENTVRVVHDPYVQMSYALTDNGLFRSLNRGISWQATDLTEAVHGLVFIDRNPPLSRLLVAGVETGVKASIDEGITWLDMSKGLLAQPHTVTYAHGYLLATGDAGYFSCNVLDCFGHAQAMAPEEDRGIVEVIEFYNTDLKHYFITGTGVEADLIDEGAAGPGWVRTGESFLAWGLGGNIEANDVCRFYGSMHPGPNSHFYSVSSSECRFLMDLQELIPDEQPRWNFEGYAFSILPPSQDEDMPCPETTTPIYRAYNDAFSRGEDSNHRYVKNRALLEPMIEEGWVFEGVAFCAPESQDISAN